MEIYDVLFNHRLNKVNKNELIKTQEVIELLLNSKYHYTGDISSQIYNDKINDLIFKIKEL